MRLLYWYTRFLDKLGNPRIHHGLKSFELNFSTQTRYRPLYRCPNSIPSSPFRRRIQEIGI